MIYIIIYRLNYECSILKIFIHVGFIKFLVFEKRKEYWLFGYFELRWTKKISKFL